MFRMKAPLCKLAKKSLSRLADSSGGRVEPHGFPDPRKPFLGPVEVH